MLFRCIRSLFAKKVNDDESSHYKYQSFNSSRSTIVYNKQILNKII